MSGHSKWHRIKHAKAATDAKRGAIFTKLAQQIKAAARAGTDPAKNSTLAEAIARAKAANMPQANIDRLLNSSKGVSLHTTTYEGFGPGGAALLIQTQTDNPNRTVAELRTLLKNHGGSLGEPGSVAWKFKPVFQITTTLPPTDQRDDLELALIEAGADDITEHDHHLTVTAPPDKQTALLEQANNHQLTINSSQATFAVGQPQEPTPDDAQKLQQLLTTLTKHPDVASVYTDTTQ